MSTLYEHPSVKNPKITKGLLLAVLGIVYGDIGTSPLYALRECFHGAHALELSSGNVLSVLSMIFWSLMIVVSFKYVLFILRAENKQEGGILALVALATSAERIRNSSHLNWVTILGLFGAALLYGDGVITPAISVLSAVEGLKLVTTELESFGVYITAVILVVLFAIQSQGTARIGWVFGPIMGCWVLTLGIL